MSEQDKGVSFYSEYMDKVKVLIQGRGHAITNGEYLDDFACQIALGVLRHRDQLQHINFRNRGEGIEALKKAMPDNFTNHTAYYHLQHNFHVISKENKQYRDLRKQEAWAAWCDRFKILLFRTVTTIMIAAVIFGTSYLAHEMKIPLPMLRAGL